MNHVVSRMSQFTIEILKLINVKKFMKYDEIYYGNQFTILTLIKYSETRTKLILITYQLT